MIHCPNCSQKLSFDIESQQMKCGYCGSLYPISVVSGMGNNNADESNVSAVFVDTSASSSYAAQIEEQQIRADLGTDEMMVTVFTCPSCGGEILSDDNTAATFCSYCGSSITLESHLSKIRKPDCVIPFHITKEKCKEIYLGEIKKRRFVPSFFKKEGNIDSFRGIYMPYWVYDIGFQDDYSFGTSTKQRQGNYDVYNHYMLTGHYEGAYYGISHDASLGFDDNLSEGIAPYNMEAAKIYNPCYMSGFYADAPDFKSDKYRNASVDVAREGLTASLMSKYKYYGLTEEKICEAYENNRIGAPTVKENLGMFPVWFLSYRVKDRMAYATINGQTGKVYADVPVDKKKYLLGSFLLMIPIFLIMMIFTIRPDRALLIASFIAFAFNLCFDREVRDMYWKELRCTPASESGLSKMKKKEKMEKAKKGLGTAILLLIYFGWQFGVGLIALLINIVAVIPLNYIFGLVSFVLMIVTLVLMIRQNKSYGAYCRKKILKNGLLNLGVYFITMVVQFANPSSDLVYYGIMIAFIILSLLPVLNLIESHNIAMTSRPRQFERTGGDDDGI